MTLVRCPTHGIPFNDQESARVPSVCAGTSGSWQPSHHDEGAGRGQPTRRRTGPRRGTRRTRFPRTGPGIPREHARHSRQHHEVRATDHRRLTNRAVLFVTAPFHRATGSSRFYGSPQPLAIMPGQPVSIVQAVLGVQQPTVHPQGAATVAHRYSYGTNLIIDDVNGFVYSLQIGVPTARGGVSKLACQNRAPEVPWP